MSRHINGRIPDRSCPFSLVCPHTAVYVGDCRQVLNQIDVGCADLIFADPPFNIGREYDQWNDRLATDEYMAFTRRWILECSKLLRPGGAFWINIPDLWAAEIAVFMKSLGAYTMQNWCVWHYRFGQNQNHRFISSKVNALYFTKNDGPRTWNPKEVLEPSDRMKKGDKRTLSKKDGMPAGMRVPLDVWYGDGWCRIQGNNAERRPLHDNQLPEVYLERVIRSCSDVGDLVLDPFLGSGTTGTVARALGRRFIGIEFSPALAASAFERIKSGPTRVKQHGKEAPQVAGESGVVSVCEGVVPDDAEREGDDRGVGDQAGEAQGEAGGSEEAAGDGRVPSIVVSDAAPVAQ